MEFSRGDVVIFDYEYVCIVAEDEVSDWDPVETLIWEWSEPWRFERIRIHKSRLVKIGSLTEAGLY